MLSSGRHAIFMTGTTAVLAIMAACAGLKQGDSDVAPLGDDEGGLPPDLNAKDAGGSLGDDDGAIRDPFPDAGDPPADFVCTDPWTAATKTQAACAPRQVRDVSPVAPLDPTGISIARTTAGRVGIVFNSEDGAETGEMWLAHFKPTAPNYAAPVIVKRQTGFAFHDGYATKIGATAPDSLHVLAHDVEDDSRSGEVRLYTLENGVEPLKTAEVVITGVAYPTELGFAVDRTSGAAYATVRVSTGTNSAKLASRVRPTAGAAWAIRPDITTLLQPKDAPHSGASSLIVDPTGQVHLLIHHNESVATSTPRYHSLDGTSWSSPKTVDNNAPDGFSGFSPRVAVFGTKKYAVYFYRKGAQTGAATADLRLATWQSSLDTPQIEILDQNIPSPVALTPEYRVAMAIDKYALLHLAIIRPSVGNIGYLDYRRQTRSGGTTKWIADTIDSDVLSDLSSAFVDLVVDENARPHIAYVSAKDGRVKYATRFDR